MMDYVSEAEALADIYDDYNNYSIYEDDFTPYSDQEKKLYLKAKSQCFKKSDIGKYVVIQDSRRNKKVMPFIILVDRSKTKAFWWSPSAFFAMVFEKQSAAEYQAKRYKYNNVRVKQITPAMANRDYYLQEYENDY